MIAIKMWVQSWKKAVLYWTLFSWTGKVWMGPHRHIIVYKPWNKRIMALFGLRWGGSGLLAIKKFTVQRKGHDLFKYMKSLKRKINTKTK